ncbi:hypothetical protein [Roseospira visakhapatnamensis]|uniref:Uncharacterized protein n=1 Tax=Roseospira visakhapatnamensis TaxID=390880 RepID=A0A7W6W9S3_9PROT|nr:hypothetical protein [Roseospira visakhapatnamensis]MBB4266103.1 hypothetical protein [Roseospira visakhapatnamensis]
MTTHIQIGDTRPRIQYLGDGNQTVFPYPFALFREADLAVYLDDDPQDGGYAVSGAGDSGGGTVTFTSAPAVGQRVTLLRHLAIARVTDFQAGGALRAAALNDELDHLTAVDQQLDEALSRAVRVPATAPDGVAAALPQPAPGAVIGWNETATALVNDPHNYAGFSEALAAIHAAAGAGAVALGHAGRAAGWARDAALSAWLVGLREDDSGDARATAVAAADRAERWADDAARSAWRAAMESGRDGGDLTVASLTTTGAVHVGGALVVTGGPVSAPLVDYGVARFTVAVASAGATVAVDPADGEVQAHTLTADTRFTLPDPPAGRGYSVSLKLIQDATGGRAPVFEQADATAARWLGGSAPAWQTVAGAFDLVVLTHDGTDLIALHAGGTT